MESIGFTQAAAVSEGTVDAAVDYAVNGPVVLTLQGIPVDQIALDAYLTVPANGLVTNEKTLAEQPDLVRRMVRALLKSVRYTLDNPDEAFRIALEFVPEAGGANDRQPRGVRRLARLLAAPHRPAPGRHPRRGSGRPRRSS